MDVKARFLKTDQILASITFTMQLSDWKELRGQLKENYPSWEFRNKIDDVIDQLEKTFEPIKP